MLYPRNVLRMAPICAAILYKYRGVVSVMSIMGLTIIILYHNFMTIIVVITITMALVLWFC